MKPSTPLPRVRPRWPTPLHRRFRSTGFRLRAPIAAVALAAMLPGPLDAANAELDSRDKLGLMAGALRARSDGDLERARAYLETLMANTPEDPGVQRLYQSIVADMARDPRYSGSAHASPQAGTPPASQPAPGELKPAAAAPYDTAHDEARNHAAPEGYPEPPADDPAHEGYRNETRTELLAEVERAWQRPRIFDRTITTHTPSEDHDLRERLSQIHIPHVSFADVALSRVLDTLSLLSEEYDPQGLGINIVLISPDSANPPVTITVRRLTMDRILDFIVESVGFEYDVQRDAVVVRRGVGEGARLETDFFPITRSTIIRLTGMGAGTAPPGSPVDPFAPHPPSHPASAGPADEERALKHFLQRAGVPFDTVPGANLALADGQIIVTQTARNMERVRNILRRYSEIKQVEIESRFLEVQQSDLEELGFQWIIGAGGRPVLDEQSRPVLRPDGRPVLDHRQRFQTGHRSLAETFGAETDTGRLEITGPPGEVGPTGRFTMPTSPPAIPRTLPIGIGAHDLAGITGLLNGVEFELFFRALARRQGSDLMSAPKITVLSGKTAEIVVAQELRYPRNFTDMQAQVGRGDSGAGSAGVAITSATPLDFTVRNIGVEMEVTPTVEDDNSISLLLEPQVTEFEGFVDYGGPSVAIASNRTVTVPSGFFQPIFSVRRIRTEVTIWDGATVVMGGLTREQAVSVEDKVPLLGDIPLLGRLFRSTGDASQKRNLLIFVTANLVSPGGSPMRQQFQAIDPGSLYQNPTLVTPGGSIPRTEPEEQ